jgi:hypothetical protein
MRKLLSLVVLAFLAVPAWASGPTVKFSFVMPISADEDPVFNALDPESLFLWQLAFRGDGNHWTIDNQYRDGEMKTSGRPRGIRLRVHTKGLNADWVSPFAVDLSWTRGQHSNTEIYSMAQYFTDTGGGEINRQVNVHQVDLHTFRFGVHYDLLYHTRRFSLEPGIGAEFFAFSDTRQTHHILGSSPDPRVLQHSTAKQWTGTNQGAPYVSLDGEVFPFGKRGIGIGVSTRYLPRPETLEVGGGTLAGEYAIPLRQRRWSTSLTATFVF